MPIVSGGRTCHQAGFTAGLSLEVTRRIRITVAYDGTDFHGWQVQAGLPTIQGALEQIVSDLDSSPVHVAGSGRTDAGVHARAQVAAFTLTNPIPCFNLEKALNRLLPPTIRVFDATEMPPEFHPRFDTIAKTYRYVLERDTVCSPFDWPYVHHYPYPLQEQKMMDAATVLEGEHDFTALSAADHSEKKKSKIRTVYSSRLERDGTRLVYTVRGSGFLKHMVRNVIGTLIEVGRGNISGHMILKQRGATALAKGLTLMSVEYPDFTAP